MNQIAELWSPLLRIAYCRSHLARGQGPCIVVDTDAIENDASDMSDGAVGPTPPTA
jgi:hypothetical protein